MGIEIARQNDRSVHQMTGRFASLIQVRESIDFGQQHLDLCETHIFASWIVQQMRRADTEHNVRIGG